MVLENVCDDNNIYDQLKERLFIQYQSDLHRIDNGIDVEKDKNIKLLVERYTFNLFKIGEVSILLHQRKEVRNKFISQKNYIDNLSISAIEKIELILTTACILTRINGYVQKMCEEKLLLLAQCMVSVPLNHYFAYEKILIGITDYIVPDMVLEQAQNDLLPIVEHGKQYVKNGDN